MVWLGLVGWVGVFLMEDTFLLYFVSRGSRLVEKRGSVGLRGSWFVWLGLGVFRVFCVCLV